MSSKSRSINNLSNILEEKSNTSTDSLLLSDLSNSTNTPPSSPYKTPPKQSLNHNSILSLSSKSHQNSNGFINLDTLFSIQKDKENFNNSTIAIEALTSLGNDSRMAFIDSKTISERLSPSKKLDLLNPSDLYQIKIKIVRKKKCCKSIKQKVYQF